MLSVDVRKTRRFQVLFYSGLIYLFLAVLGCSVLFKEGDSFVSYTVRKGDTLGSISEAYGVSISQLVEANNLSDPDLLYPGQLLLLPYHYMAGDRREPDLGLGSENYEIGRVDLESARRMQGRLELPVRGARLSSFFGKRLFRFHEGIDLSVKKGTPIFAAHNGQVIYSGTHISGYGNVIAIRGDHGLVTIYAHNDRNVVRRGQWVEGGHLIGYVGSTGRASGPHLHFETRISKPGKGLVAVDPLYFFETSGKS